MFGDDINGAGKTRIRASLVDDQDFSLTHQFTRIVELLRLLHNAIIRIIESWESFEEGEVQYFQVEQDTLRTLWNAHLADIEKDVRELRSLRRSLQQKIEIFDNKRNGVSAGNPTITTFS